MKTQFLLPGHWNLTGDPAIDLYFFPPTQFKNVNPTKGMKVRLVHKLNVNS